MAAAVGNKSIGPFNFPGSSGFFRANDDRCSDGEGVCLTGGDFSPFVFNKSSTDYLSVAVDGAVQTLRLLSSIPDVHTAATVLRQGLKGVRVDVVSGNNSARNGEHDRSYKRRCSLLTPIVPAVFQPALRSRACS